MPPTSHLLTVFSLCICTTALTACQPPNERPPSTASSEQPTTPLNQGQSDHSAEPDHNTQPQKTVAKPPTTANLAPQELHHNYAKVIAEMRKEMQLMLALNNVDVAFARGMLGHHRAAVDLTRLHQRHGGDARLRQLATDIMATEKKEINALRKWLASHPDTHTAEAATTEVQQAYRYSMHAMNSRIDHALDSPTSDIAFAKIMLAHHRGAQAMANIQLKYGDDEQMRVLAAHILDEGRSDIREIKAWLTSQGIDDNPRLLPHKLTKAPQLPAASTSAPLPDAAIETERPITNEVTSHHATDADQ